MNSWKDIANFSFHVHINVHHGMLCIENVKEKGELQIRGWIRIIYFLVQFKTTIYTDMIMCKHYDMKSWL